MIILSICTPITVLAQEVGEEALQTENNKVQLTVSLKDFEMTEKNQTNNISFCIKNTKTREKVYFTFSKENNWTDIKEVVPGTYKIDDQNGVADNKMRVLIKEGSIEVKPSVASKVELTVEKIQNNGFFASFLRNNSVTLVLLVISSIAYLIFRQRRLNGAPQKTISL